MLGAGMEPAGKMQQGSGLGAGLFVPRDLYVHETHLAQPHATLQSVQHALRDRTRITR